MQQLMSNFRTMFLFRGLAAILFGAPASFPMNVARYVDGADRSGIGHLRHVYRCSTRIRAARRDLVDRCLRDRVGGHVHRGVLPITLTGFEPGLNSIRSEGHPVRDLLAMGLDRRRRVEEAGSDEDR